MSTASHNLESSSAEILNSWKEIACYMNRGVRTVQRWEAELGMPVRRPRGKGRSAVVAVRAELDRWIKSCPLEANGQLTTEVATSLMIAPLKASTLELHRLRDEINRSRGQATIALNVLIANVEKMKRESSMRAGISLAYAAAVPEPSTA